ncbi:MAG: TonB-dependent receptor, partial [Phaeodactylibacter sp.]|nr:TonB-dependent receptor [Phaeodactylibacter sp.]
DRLGIIGAYITTKSDPGIGTVTDLSGKYSIQVPDENTILVFSYTGMKTKEVQVGNQRQLDVTLEPDISTLDEVVIIGYGYQKRSQISGAVSVVTAEEITETPVLRVEQALQGRTAGVQVTQNSGSPGAALSVRVRGTGTINNSDPLYIVDGVQVDGLDFLNPNDIASINVLKDAASAAIYGARGANGVVLITTHSGSASPTGSIKYEAYYGRQSPWRKLSLLNAQEYATIQNEAFIAAGKLPRAEFANPEALGEGTDWQDAVFTTAPIMSHQLSFSGGSAKSSYAVSGNYFLQEGIVGGDKSRFERYTARLNTRHQMKSWLEIGNTLGITWLQRDALPENNEFTTPLIRAINMDPVTPVYKPDGTFAYSRYSDTDITNPVNQIDLTYDTWTTNRLMGSIFGVLKFSDALSLRSTYSLDATFATQDIFLPRFDLSVDTVLSDAPAQEKRKVNTVILNHNTWKNWQWENVLTWQKKLAGDHDLTVMAGNTVLENRYEFAGAANTNLPSNRVEDAYISNTIDPIESQSASEWATESALLSFFGRVNYDFRSRYLFSATFRADGSSRFGRNNRFGYFPSASLGWVVSEEKFWSSTTVTFLKLRASWGQNGNDKIGDYRFTSVVRSGQNYTFGPGETITNGSVALEAANPDLKWETITQTNIGLDVELWSGKLNLIADYFIKTTADMLYAAPIPLAAGTEPPIQNIATMENRGLELTANHRNSAGAFNYDLGANLTLINNEVTGLGSGGEPVFSGNIQSGGFAAITDIGLPIASFYGYVTDGIFQNVSEIEDHAFQSENTAPGDLRFVDLNEDGVINEQDRTVIGNPIPKFTYSFTGTLEFKGIDLSIFIFGIQGNDIYNGRTRWDLTTTNRPASILNRWTGPGTSNSEPRVNLNDPNQNARVSDRFVEDGSFLRLKNVQIGYSLPATVLDKIKFNKLRIYVSGQNLLTFTEYTGLDPEIGVINTQNSLEIGIDRGYYPQPRTILGGIQVEF